VTDHDTSRRGANVIAALVFALSLGLVAWSAWIYHFAVVADTTDESARFWIGLGSLLLAVGCVGLYFGARALRQRRPSRLDGR